MQPSTRERWRQLAKLEGLISEQTGVELAKLAATVPGDHAIVEVGSFKGKSTAYLAEGARLGHGARVFAVDPWDSQPEPGKHGYNSPNVRKAFDAQLRSLDLRSGVTARKLYSKEAADKWKDIPVGLLYIDGDHEYDSVLDDFANWLPHMAVPALVAFDDYGTRNKGVTRFVNELRATRHWKVDTTNFPLAVARQII